MKRVNVTFLKSLMCSLLAVVALSATANAWWNDEWTVRKKVTIDTTDKGVEMPDAPGATIPVLIRLHDGNFKFDNAKEDGSDLRFVSADDKTLLTYHVEKWDGLMGEAFVWVKVPNVKPGVETTFWLYCGNSGPKAVNVDDVKGTYDGDTALVYHFSEHGSPAIDASVSGANAQIAGIAADGSMIGTGMRLEGKTVTIPTAPALFWTDGGAMTWSAWVKGAAPQPNAVIYIRREGSKAFIIGADKGVPFVEVTAANGATQRSQPKAATALPPNSWHHLAVVASGSTITLYLDGESFATLNAPLPGMNSAAMIGGDVEAGSTDAAAGEAGFKGEIDELEISKTARSPGFIKFAATSQGKDKAASLLKYGEDEQTSSMLSTGYFGVIIKNLSVDGWVVIGILAVMACISWYVMVTKVSMLNAVTAGNGLFLKEWQHMAADLTVLDNPDSDVAKNLGAGTGKTGQRTLRRSPLYRIYHLGVEEIRQRIAADKCGDGRKGLSGRSIQAIRASLDGGLVRETQRINNKIVLLTICISGGPFLGLLGTVVGVMITFAAVAAAGEVNVNAIAPGIAAALLATVAGLSVAIPSLFGYNYILTRVKEATSDMHVFIDEFVTRMAEFYRE